ncbi:hypothetical protein [Cytobacillus sp. NCCP-133]|uniref:hypothetical protein n=1 Tax=Cytobacillus sp. NCCP-133 TaxID=766848 RepID=UPI002230C97B|nr:hypothetical protein [Cytobacillus sp. NCCP-133]GLB58894.1 UDP-glucose 4-epimerase [Cytobacillus sp. NCCP-133]
MDRAVIVGTFEFVGFSLCKHLLELGSEIEGIHISKGEEDYFTEDKRLEIGRNANFYENNYTEWMESKKEIKEGTVFFIDFYDYYLMNKLSAIRENEIIDNFLIRHITELAKSKSKLVFLFPLQWVKDINRAHSRCERAMETLKENNVCVHSFYLPAVYGPWQPKEFLYHQAILGRRKAAINNREWIHDAIFIDDLIQSIVQEAEKKQGGSFLLKSSLPGHWQKCAEYLSIEYSKSHRNENLEIGNIIEIAVKCSVEYKEGIELQRRHIQSWHSRNRD